MGVKKNLFIIPKRKSVLMPCPTNNNITDNNISSVNLFIRDQSPTRVELIGKINESDETTESKIMKNKKRKELLSYRVQRIRELLPIRGEPKKVSTVSVLEAARLYALVLQRQA